MASDAETQRARYDHVSLWLPKGEKAEIDTLARANGFRGVNAFVKEAIRRLKTELQHKPHD
jgi:hypothetical protein